LKISRVNIYLDIITFLKSLLPWMNKKKDKLNALNKFKKITGKEFINLTGMCRTGLIVALDYLRQKDPKKNEVIVFAYNLQEFIEIIKNKGFVIKFVDISENGVPLINDIKNEINKNTAALLFTNMFADFEYLQSVKKISNENNLLLIEDCAIFLGNYEEINNVKSYSGSVGDISLYSFGIMKNLCAIYGGAIATNDKNISLFLSNKITKLNKFPNLLYCKKILLFLLLKLFLSNFIFILFFSKVNKYIHKSKNIKLLKIFYPSLNFIKKNKIPNYYLSKIHPIAERIFVNILNANRLEKDFDIRKKNNALYLEYLKPSDNFKIIKIKNKSYQNFLEFPIIVKNKEIFIRKLLSKNFDIRFFYYYNCIFLAGNDIAKKFIYSELFERNIICLPNHYKINKNYIKVISNIINNI